MWLGSTRPRRLPRAGDEEGARFVAPQTAGEDEGAQRHEARRDCHIDEQPHPEAHADDLDGHEGDEAGGEDREEGELGSASEDGGRVGREDEQHVDRLL